MVELTIHLTDEDARRLQEQARMMGMEPEELASSLVANALSGLSEDVKILVNEEPKENTGLHRPLS